MYKIIQNNRIIDVMEKLRYVKYLPKTQKTISVDERQANGILSSNGTEVYHLYGTKNTFPDDVKIVECLKIDLEEYERLTKQLKENDELLERVNSLEKTLKELQQKIGQ